jgi:hypothetical protein
MDNVVLTRWGFAGAQPSRRLSGCICHRHDLCTRNLSGSHEAGHRSDPSGDFLLVVNMEMGLITPSTGIDLYVDS